MERGNEIWELKNRDVTLIKIVDDLVGELKEVPKSKIDSFILGRLKDILEEKKILEGLHE